ncbi:hypothetical protein HYT84_00635 [Candidatus Micrarchaeota archaeon]|nr:hypothetical protein [Candidatus Micrarchaeota archaeon]
MFKSLGAGLDAFKANPFQFVYATFISVLLNLVVLLALLGVYLIFFLIMSVLNQTSLVYAFVIFAAFLTLIYVYFLSAFKGSLIRSYQQLISKKGRFSVRDFYGYALSNGSNFFALTLLKLFLLIVLIAPLVAFYYFYLLAHPIKYVDYLLLVLGLGVLFIVEMVFNPAYMAAALYGSGPGRSLKFSFDFYRKKHVLGFLFFVMYSFVWLFNLVPLIQLGSLLIVFPILYSGFIILFQNTIMKVKA